MNRQDTLRCGYGAHGFDGVVLRDSGTTAGVERDPRKGEATPREPQCAHSAAVDHLTLRQRQHVVQHVA